MSAVRKYNTTVNGFPTVVKLSDADAKAQGLTLADLAEPAAVVIAIPEQHAEDLADTATDDTSAAAKSRAPRNKARQPAADKEA